MSNQELRVVEIKIPAQSLLSEGVLVRRSEDNKFIREIVLRFEPGEDAPHGLLVATEGDE